MRFRAIIQLSGKTSTGISVPSEVVEGLGSGKRPAVRVTLNGYIYRSTVAPMGGEFLIPISAENRERAGVKAGDEVDERKSRGKIEDRILRRPCRIKPQHVRNSSERAIESPRVAKVNGASDACLDARELKLEKRCISLLTCHKGLKERPSLVVIRRRA